VAVYVILALRRTAIWVFVHVLTMPLGEMSVFEKYQPSRRTDWMQAANLREDRGKISHG
jgi:hypothetical protein